MPAIISPNCVKANHYLDSCELPSICQCTCHQPQTNRLPSCPPHKPHNLGMVIAGPSPTGLMIDRIQFHLCVKCSLVYGEALPSIPPPMTGRQN
mgnify:CR=1 FL=1